MIKDMKKIFRTELVAYYNKLNGVETLHPGVSPSEYRNMN